MIAYRLTIGDLAAKQLSDAGLEKSGKLGLDHNSEICATIQVKGLSASGSAISSPP